MKSIATAIVAVIMIMPLIGITTASAKKFKDPHHSYHSKIPTAETPALLPKMRHQGEEGCRIRGEGRAVLELTERPSSALIRAVKDFLEAQLLGSSNAAL